MNKAKVKKWLDERGYEFPTMTDEQKLDMRQALGICGAASAVSKFQFPCCRPPSSNGRCKKHGGASLKGPQSPQWSTGKYSRYLPTRLIERYEAAERDDGLQDLRSELSLTDARLAELLEQLDRGGGIEDWARVRGMWEAYLAAQRRLQATPAEDAAAIGRAQDDVRRTMRDLNELIERGHRNISLWHEINDTIELRRRLKTSDSKMLIDLQNMISAERIMAFMYRLSGILKSRIKDDKLLSEISEDIRSEVTRVTG